MSKKQVWFITGAGRGLGVDIANAALAAGHAVVGTAREIQSIENAIGKSDDFLAVKLDITQPQTAESAVRLAVERFGRIDVLVNNAGNFYAGYFEDLSPEDIQKQIDTNLIGPMNVTRAVLPEMRKQRSGLVMTISSTAGLFGIEFGSAYALSKFGVEGWMLSLAPEIEPFGIRTTIVNPGFFRTDLLSQKSMTFGSKPTEAYKARRAEMEVGWSGAAGTQAGDPKKLASALVTIAAKPVPPKRFIAGADAVEGARKVAADLLQQTSENLALSTSLGFSD